MRHGHKHPKFDGKKPEHKCCPKCEKMNCHKHPKFEGKHGHRHPGFGWKQAHKEAKCEEVKAEENKANE